jgi:hypothetical protein
MKLHHLRLTVETPDVFSTGHVCRRLNEVTDDVSPEWNVGAIVPEDPQPAAQAETVESILGTISGTVFRSEAGEALIMTDEDNYVISVDEGGHTVSAYLVTVHPAEIAAAMGTSDLGEFSGWTTGWDC